MPDMKLLASGELPPPSGQYSFSLSGNILHVHSQANRLALEVGGIAKLSVGWAVPAKGGGYVYLSALLKDGREQALVESSGYDDGLRDRYLGLANDLAGELGLKFQPRPLGADA